MSNKHLLTIYGFAYCGHVMQVESYHMWPFVLGFFIYNAFSCPSILYPLAELASLFVVE